MKDKIIRFWLTHHYLRKIGKRYPEFFVGLMNDITDSAQEVRVMKERYIYNKKFEVIAMDMNISDRYVFRLHQRIVDRLVEL